MTGPRILIVEDEARIADLVAGALRAEGFNTDVALDAEQAIEMATGTRYDLVILDLLMPGRGGVGVLQELVARRPLLHVMILSALGDVDSKVLALNLGATDYVTKPFSVDELLARVRARLRVDRRFEPASLGRDDRRLSTTKLDLDADRQEADAGLGPVPLSRREYLLLRELIKNAGQTVSKERLLSSVWGFSHDPASNVVDVYVRRVRAKLGDEVITTVRGQGYRVDA